MFFRPAIPIPKLANNLGLLLTNGIDLHQISVPTHKQSTEIARVESTHPGSSTMSNMETEINRIIEKYVADMDALDYTRGNKKAAENGKESDVDSAKHECKEAM